MLNPETPIDISFYAEQLSTLQADPNTRIVGSIGRMVTSQQTVCTPFTEFDNRVVVGLDTTRVSDIDVLGTCPDLVIVARNVGEANVDNLAFRDSDVTLENGDGVWVLKSTDVDLEEAIDSEVMDPVSAKVEDIEIVTVLLQTHIAPHGLRERNNKKDLLTETTLGCLHHEEFRN